MLFWIPLISQVNLNAYTWDYIEKFMRQEYLETSLYSLEEGEAEAALVA